jgi:hypothetical protein
MSVCVCVCMSDVCVLISPLNNLITTELSFFKLGMNVHHAT